MTKNSLNIKGGRRRKLCHFHFMSVIKKLLQSWVMRHSNLDFVDFENYGSALCWINMPIIIFYDCIVFKIYWICTEEEGSAFITKGAADVDGFSPLSIFSLVKLCSREYWIGWAHTGFPWLWQSFFILSPSAHATTPKSSWELVPFTYILQHS